MRLRSELRLILGILLGLQVLTSFVGIALLSRIAPAVEQILVDNVASNRAAEEMLAAIALRDAIPEAERRERFADALRRATENVTEPEEPPLLQVISAGAPEALAGDPEARLEVVEALDAFAAINRASMVESDLAAQRIGAAGAWAMVLLGLGGFGFGVLLIRRLSGRLEQPIEEIDATLEAARTGDPHRRAFVGDCPEELGRISRQVNALLDEQEQAEPPRSEAPAQG